MRYTEYHAGKAVIRDEALLPQAVRKLAKLEDLGDLRETVCDRYCKYPYVSPDQGTLDNICSAANWRNCLMF